jgi:hypothetical protein
MSDGAIYSEALSGATRYAGIYAGACLGNGTMTSGFAGGVPLAIDISTVTWRIREPLEHRDYVVVDHDCICFICDEWRKRQAIMEEARVPVRTHRYNCLCKRCHRMRMAYRSYLAMVNARDFYCEMAWHAGYSLSGSAMMQWAAEQVSQHDDQWWANDGAASSVGKWLTLFGEIPAESLAMILEAMASRASI